MYEIHIKGKKIAVLLVWTNILGYGEPYITLEEGSDEDFVMHCEIETKHDGNPFGYTDKDWDGKIADLSIYNEATLRNGEFRYCFENYGLIFLSGYLDVEIETLNNPDDSCVPFCAFGHYANGNLIAEYEFENPDFENEGFARCKLKFDKWHDFDF